MRIRILFKLKLNYFTDMPPKKTITEPNVTVPNGDAAKGRDIFD